MSVHLILRPRDDHTTTAGYHGGANQRQDEKWEYKPDALTQRELEKVRVIAGQSHYRDPSQKSESEIIHGSFGIRGLAKSIQKPDREERSLDGGRGCRGSYGEDEAWVHFYDGMHADHPFQVYIGAIADGHGPSGHIPSQLTMDFVNVHLSSLSEQGTILSHLLQGKEQVQTYWNEFFRILDQNCPMKHAGTTLTLAMVYLYRGRLLTVCANVGDSPALLVNHKNGRVHEVYKADNWDDPEVRSRSLQASVKAGMAPPTIVYGRWNTDGNRTVPNRFGDFKPIPLFKGNSVEVDNTNRLHVMEAMRQYCGDGMIGGSQTVRKMVQWRRRDGQDWEKIGLEEYGHLNWGSTPIYWNQWVGEWGGGCQMFQSIGDQQHKKHRKDNGGYLMTCVPTVTVLELIPEKREDFSLFILSDGAGDCLYFHSLAERGKKFFSERPEATMEDCLEEVYEYVYQEGIHSFPPGRGKRFSDDMSMVGMRFIVQPNSFSK